jgi:hypothetical protein
MSTDPETTYPSPSLPWHQALPRPIGWIAYGILLPLLILLLWRPVFDWWVVGDLRSAGASVWYAKGTYIVEPGKDKDASVVLNSALVKLNSLPNDIWIRLGHTDATDTSLAYLEGLESNLEIDLSETEITDVGLMHLAKLPNLKWLVLKGTRVTDDGVKSLQEALPKCKIER